MRALAGLSVKRALLIVVCLLAVIVSLPWLFLENIDLIFLRQQESASSNGGQKLRKATRKDYMTSLDYEEHYSNALCRCPGVSEQQIKTAVQIATSTTFIKLKKPQSRFHSNHWFHIGEYFLSKHADIETNSIMKNGDTVILMANEVDFAIQLTNVAAFFILLGFGPTAKRLEVHMPSYVYKSTDKGNTDFVEWGSFVSSTAPTFVFDSTAPFARQFQSYKDLRLRSQDKETETNKDKETETEKKKEKEEEEEETKTKTPTETETEEQCHCGKFLGGVGKTPVSSTSWFPDAVGVQKVREKIALMCQGAPEYYQQRPPSELVHIQFVSSKGGIASSIHAGQEQEIQHEQKQDTGKGINQDANRDVEVDKDAANRDKDADRDSSANKHTQKQKQKQKRFKLVIYERDSNRHFAGLSDLLKNLRSTLSSSWDVRLLTHDESIHPCLLHHVLRDADVYLTTHGFQSTAVSTPLIILIFRLLDFSIARFLDFLLSRCLDC